MRSETCKNSEKTFVILVKCIQPMNLRFKLDQARENSVHQYQETP